MHAIAVAMRVLSDDQQIADKSPLVDRSRPLAYCRTVRERRGLDRSDEMRSDRMLKRKSAAQSDGHVGAWITVCQTAGNRSLKNRCMLSWAGEMGFGGQGGHDVSGA